MNNKLIFIDSFQFLSSLLGILAENSDKNNFNYLSQELDNNASDLVKQKGFDSYENMSNFQKFKEE